MKGIGLLCLQFTNMMKKTLCAMKMDFFDDLFGPSVESVDNSRGRIITKRDVRMMIFTTH